MYLKIYDFRDYDEYYVKLTDKEKTWKEILNHIENVLEDRLFETKERLIGIDVHFQIVDEMPENVETA